MSFKEFLSDPETRKWLYGIAAAVIPLLVIGGQFTTEEGQAFLNLVASVLAVGTSSLAIKNVPAPTPPVDNEVDEPTE